MWGQRGAGVVMGNTKEYTRIYDVRNGNVSRPKKYGNIPVLSTTGT